MSELFITLPPPRRVESESTLTFALVLATAIYTVPFVTAAPEPDAMFVEFDDGYTCCFGCHRDELEEPPPEELMASPCPNNEPPEFRDPAMSRAYAVEYALEFLSRSPRRELTLVPEYSIDHGEIVLDDNRGYERPLWKLRQFPQLAPSMQSTTRPRPAFAATVQGALPRASVARVVKRNQQAFAACDDTRPSLDLAARERHVTLAATFMVNAEGRVAGEIVITGSDDPINTCVKRVASQLVFPRSEGNTQINIPLRYGTTLTSAEVFVR